MKDFMERLVDSASDDSELCRMAAVAFTLKPATQGSSHNWDNSQMRSHGLALGVLG